MRCRPLYNICAAGRDRPRSPTYSHTSLAHSPCLYGPPYLTDLLHLTHLLELTSYLAPLTYLLTCLLTYSASSSYLPRIAHQVELDSMRLGTDLTKLQLGRLLLSASAVDGSEAQQAFPMLQALTVLQTLTMLQALTVLPPLAMLLGPPPRRN